MAWMQTVSGFLVGLIVGLTGVGGGSLMTPLLVLFFGINPATAIGTDLLYASITKFGGAITHARQKTVNWMVVRRLAFGSIPATLATLAVMHFAGKPPAALTHILTTALGCGLILTAAAILFRNRLLQYGEAIYYSPWMQKWRPALTVLVGLLLGILVTLSSVGAGALGVAALYFFYPTLPAVVIVGSDIVHAVPLTLVAGLGHASMGGVNFPLLFALLLGSLPGIVIGSKLSRRLPEQYLRAGLAFLLTIIGGRLVF